MIERHPGRIMDSGWLAREQNVYIGTARVLFNVLDTTCTWCFGLVPPSHFFRRLHCTLSSTVKLNLLHVRR